MTSESVLLSVVTFGAVIWLYLGVVELAYNRCKRRQTENLLMRSVKALKHLSATHACMTDHGPCTCDAHREARMVVDAYHIELSRRIKHGRSHVGKTETKRQ